MDDKKDKINKSQSNNLELESIDKGIDIFNFNKKDKNLSFVFQKVKKLVAAIYLITNFFEDSEPLKWSFRKLGTEMIGGLSSHHYGTPHVFKEKVREMVALLEVASISGLVSSMNLDVLKKEFTDLIVRVEQDDFFGTRSSVSFSDEFFTVYESQKTEKEITATISNVFEKNNVFNKQEDKVSDIGSAPKGDQSLKKEVKSQSLKDFSPVVVKKNRRQSAIVALLRRKKEIMVKDVALVITDCSEKTIQRELLTLVEQGVLKKQGERRWTKYSLV